MSRRFPPSKSEILASNSEDPAELEELSRHRSGFVRTAVARNSRTPAHVLTTLAGDADSYVRSAVARHQSTPVETLRAMVQADDPDPFVRASLARNTHTPAELLTRSIADNVQVRRMMAANPSADPATLRALACDTDREIREALARNRSTPDDVLIALAGVDSSAIADALSKRNFTDDTIAWRTAKKRRRHPYGGAHDVVTNIPVDLGGRFAPDLLRAMCRSQHYALRRTVASQPDAPLDVLDAMSRDGDKWIRVRVAENPGLSPELVARMAAEDAEEEVVKALAARDDLNDEAIMAIAVRRFSKARLLLPKRSFEVLMAHPMAATRAIAAYVLHRFDDDQTEPYERMLADPDPQVRVAAAQTAPESMLLHHECHRVREVLAERTRDAEVLVVLSGDEVATVRRRVAKNPCCPLEVITVLSGDRDLRARRNAAARFLGAMTGPL